MNFLTKLLDSIVNFVKQMPLFVIIVVVIAFVAPSLLGYMFYALLGLVALVILAFAIFAWRLRRVQRDLHEQFRRAGEQNGHRQYSYRRNTTNEGDVSIHTTPAMPEKKISDDVGEYVDFKEEKTNNK